MCQYESEHTLPPLCGTLATLQVTPSSGTYIHVDTCRYRVHHTCSIHDRRKHTYCTMFGKCSSTKQCACSVLLLCADILLFFEVHVSNINPLCPRSECEYGHHSLAHSHHHPPPPHGGEGADRADGQSSPHHPLHPAQDWPRPTDAGTQFTCNK